MKADEREQARRLGVYVDELVVRHRDAGADAPSAQDQELADLRDLARHLAAARIVAPEGFQEALAARLRTQDVAAPSRRSVWARASAAASFLLPWNVPRFALTGAGLLAAILLFSSTVIDQPVLSAETLLARSDAALAALVGDDQVLYRKWRVRSSGGPSMMTGTAQPGRIIEEWMDGADIERVAARWSTLDGRLQVAYTTVITGGDYRPHVYFAPGLYGEDRGLLNIEPSWGEFEAGVMNFSQPVSQALRVYLDRHYIYAPIRGERAYNRALVSQHSNALAEMPRVLVSLDGAQRLNGMPVYRVRLVDSASVTFNWRSTGPPVVRIAQAEIVRYISQESFLSVRTEERLVFEDGRQRESVRELEATEVFSRQKLASDPFILDVPSGTPVRWQSAQEHLSAVAEVLRRRVPLANSR